MRNELSAICHRLVTSSLRLVLLLGMVAAAVSSAAAARHAVTSTPSCRAGALEHLGGDRRAYVAVAGQELAARAAPWGRVVARFGLLNQNAYPSLFSVRGRVVDARCRTAWYLVQLPLRPNGRVGYVAAWRVTVAPVTARIDVDLSARRLRLFTAGRLRLTTPAGIGAPDTPTPVGRFYVNQILLPPEPDGPFGPVAFGVSAFSPTLTDWPQGGPIAIHGTDDPTSIGAADTHGCVRISNDAALTLRRLVPAGTPVVISR